MSPQPHLHHPYDHLELESQHFSSTLSPLPTFPRPCDPSLTTPMCVCLCGGGLVKFGHRSHRCPLMQQTDRHWPPQYCLRAAHVLSAIPTTTVGTELPDDANRSLRQTFCTGTAGDGPYAAEGILPATALLLSKHCALNSQINSNNYCFSSFNNVDLLRSMSADCCMHQRWGWGTMAAVGWWRLPWLAGACILPSFS